MSHKRPRPMSNNSSLPDRTTEGSGRSVNTSNSTSVSVSVTIRSALQQALDFFGHYGHGGDASIGYGGRGHGYGRMVKLSPEEELKELNRLKRIFLRDNNHDFLGDGDSEKIVANGPSPSRSKSQSHSAIANVLHCQQSETWDCGLACILMVLRWIKGVKGEFLLEQNENGNNAVCSEGEAIENDNRDGEDLDQNNYEDNLPKNVPIETIGTSQTYPPTIQEIQQKHKLLRAVGTESIWTIDLVMLIEKILCGDFNFLSDKEATSVSYLFCSKNMGVDQSYRVLNYYKQSFRKDERRVKRLFISAREQNLPTIELTSRQLHLDFVVAMISRQDVDVIAMVLIDNNVLLRCKEEPELNWDGEYTYDPALSVFSGHYILLCGISRDKSDIDTAKKRGNVKDKYGKEENSFADYCMVVKDPGSVESTDFIMPSLFERAWKTRGTDNDVIFIALHS